MRVLATRHASCWAAQPASHKLKCVNVQLRIDMAATTHQHLQHGIAPHNSCAPGKIMDFILQRADLGRKPSFPVPRPRERTNMDMDVQARATPQHTRDTRAMTLTEALAARRHATKDLQPTCDGDVTPCCCTCGWLQDQHHANTTAAPPPQQLPADMCAAGLAAGQGRGVSSK